MPPDFYTILGVSRSSSAAVLKRAYRQLALRYHPDRNHGDESSTEKFKEISLAYDTLGDATRRRQYDLGLAAKRQAKSAAKAEPAHPYTDAEMAAFFREFMSMYANYSEHMSQAPRKSASRPQPAPGPDWRTWKIRPKLLLAILGTTALICALGYGGLMARWLLVAVYFYTPIFAIRGFMKLRA